MRNSLLLLLSACLLALILSLSPSMARAGMTADQIMQKVDARDDGDNQVNDMEMVLTDRHGNKRVRKIKAYSKDKGRDTYKIMFFLSPPDVADTGFLNYDYRDPERDDDQWMHLPALHKTKRIASSDKSNPFMGSDFSYADMTKRDIENYNYKLLKEGQVDGHPVWIIESVPKNERIVDMYGYTKTILLVRKDIFMVVRAVNFVKEGSRLKYLDVRRLEQIDGIWVGTEVHMKTTKGKQTLHQTTLKFSNVRFNQDLDWDMFTTRRLEKGL
jgi:outer membrane lipoprotein-sorting protein